MEKTEEDCKGQNKIKGPGQKERSHPGLPLQAPKQSLLLDFLPDSPTGENQSYFRKFLQGSNLISLICHLQWPLSWALYIGQVCILTPVHTAQLLLHTRSSKPGYFPSHMGCILFQLLILWCLPGPHSVLRSSKDEYSSLACKCVLISGFSEHLCLWLLTAFLFVKCRLFPTSRKGHTALVNKKTHQ